jgi:hypothetical protein
MDAHKYALLKFNRTNNVGDEIQSLAVHRFLPRVDHLVDRDRISEFFPTEPTKLVVNGWFCHNPECFDFNENIIPLITSLHVTPDRGAGGVSLPFSEAVQKIPAVRELLKAFGPVGARDVFTLRLLEDAGVPAYFSGCVTLTFERPKGPRSDDVILADVPHQMALRVRNSTDRNIVLVRHSYDKKLESGAMWTRAQKMLRDYGRAHLVVTSRLHVALPCLAMGTNVLLVGDHLGDPRYEGLKDLCNHCTVDEFSGIHAGYIDNPDPNPSRHLALRSEMIDRVEAFVKDGARMPARSGRWGGSTGWATAHYLDQKLLEKTTENRAILAGKTALEQNFEQVRAERDELLRALSQRSPGDGSGA